jgi:hypothetical protein
MAYNVYVIELDKEVLTSKKFRDINPNMNPRRACYYVGQTTHDPITRFKQHKAGYKANRFAKNMDIDLFQGSSKNIILLKNEKMQNK